MSRFAMIAGQGALPAHVAQGLKGRDWFACHLDGYAPRAVGQSRPFRIETLGTLLDQLRADGVTQVCFAGAIARPSLDPSRVDAATMPLVPRMVAALEDGDDGALRTVIALFEEAGLEVVAPQDVAPHLLDVPFAGLATERDRSDIARAAEVHAALAPLDVGQGCVVAGGQVLAIEATPGTDWMLASLAHAPPAPPRPARGFDPFGGAADWLSGGPVNRGLPDFPRPPGGVFFKAPKPGQDRRIDLPTIGPDTVRRAAAAGLSGIAVEEGGVLVLDREDMVAQLRATGLFLAPWTRG